MDQPFFGNEKEYLDSIMSLVNSTNSFLLDMRNRNLKPLSMAGKGRLDDILAHLQNPELGSVSHLVEPVSLLSKELTTLTGKFYSIQNNYRSDATFKTILGDYKSGPEKAHTRLLGYISASLEQVDKVLMAHKYVHDGMNIPKRWILTVLANQNPPKIQAKARNTKQLLTNLEIVNVEIRSICYDVKVSLVKSKNRINTFLKPRDYYV